MPRPKRKRRITCYPEANYFKPIGIPVRELQQVILSCEEFEAIRLKDFLGKDQKEAAAQMFISQSTFHRILIEARKKIAEVFVMGKAIKIEGGNFIMKEKKSGEKIAISTFSDNLEGDIDSRFGRCSYFLLIKLENEKMSLLEAIKNIHKDMQGGAGISVAEMIASQNIGTVITGNIGPRALEVLNQFHINVFKFNGTIKESMKNFVEKKLTQIK